MDGHDDSYLSPLDEKRFCDLLCERANELNCITSRDALLIASDLALQRRRIAAMVLGTPRLQTPLDFLDVAPPSREWLRTMATDLPCSSAPRASSRPFVVHLESLVQFTHLASFASSASGWMMSDPFAAFAIDF
jgi:hypothetical protein